MLTASASLQEIKVADEVQLAAETVESDRPNEGSLADQLPQLDSDVSDEELNLGDENPSQLGDKEILDVDPQLDADVSDEELGLDDEKLSDLSDIQFVDKVPELDLSSSGQFEKIEIPNEVSASDPEVNLEPDELSQLGKNELLDKVAMMDSQLQKLKVQNEVASVDRAWEREKKKYEVVGEHGHRHLPTKEGSVVVGVLVAVVGAFWIAATSGFPGGIAVSFVGVAIIIIGVGISIYSYNRADKYEQAKRRYMRRRTKVNRKR